MPAFNPKHLKTLLAMSYFPQGRVGRVPLAWAERVVAADSINSLCLRNSQFTRSELMQYCEAPTTCIESCFISVMAWGGMWFNHGRSVWQTRIEWIPTLKKLRSEKLSWEEVFNLFKELRDHKKLPGMRAPYFTKLIFFLQPPHDGYIMDQWTAKSVNVLFGSRVVNLNPKGLVDDKNDSTNYGQFCSCIEQVASAYAQKNDSWKEHTLTFGGEQAEELIFAKPGSPWRKYVNAHWAKI
jgi:hypothetical protein